MILFCLEMKSSLITENMEEKSFELELELL